MKRKICIVTGTRSEYGIFLPLLKELRGDSACDLQIIASCMHLSPEFGLTYRQIEADGFHIDKKVEMLLSSDTPVAIAKSMGLTMISMADALNDLKPDVVVLLGDRFETLATAATATALRIPVAHIHGGEVTEGAIDDAFRHSISKMSYWHFASTEDHRQRVIRLGESPDRVFNTGAMTVDNIKSMNLMGLEELEASLGFKFGKSNLMVTFHPVTQEKESPAGQFRELLGALTELKDTHIVFTKPNADTDGRVLIPMIENFVAENSQRAVAHTSLGTLRYLSTLQFVDAMVGNSSSGIIEAPYFGIATIDIGDRQKGRARPSSVLTCEPKAQVILKAIERGISKEFRAQIKTQELPYGSGGAAKEIKTKLLTLQLPKDLKKSFYEA